MLATADVAWSNPVGGPCTHRSASAIDQYCEDLPTASGPATPSLGTPALGPALPQRLRAGLVRSRSSGGLRARRALLTLPAAGPRHPLGGPVESRVNVSGWSLFGPLIIALVASALALGATVLVRQWRERSRSAGST